MSSLYTLLLLLLSCSIFINGETETLKDDDKVDTETCSWRDGDCEKDEFQDEEYLFKTGFDEQWDRIKNSWNNQLKSLYIDCVDSEDQCELWAQYGECDKNPHHMRVFCRKSCGECKDYDVDMGELQLITGKEADATYEIFKKSVLYKKNEIVAQPEKHSFDVQSTCVNKHELCAFWASIGECTVNPGYMKLQCGPSCRSCHLIDINNRCPLDPNAEDALGPNDLNDLFLRITDVNGPFKDYEPVVHSHPKGLVDPDKIKYADDPLLDGPWVVTFESFHTDEEADRLIELGAQKGYERSTDVGERLPDGTYGKTESDSRTSYNAWCVDECETDPVAQRVVERIGNTTGINKIFHENLQLLHYTEGQYYKQHHDFIPHQVERQCGPRILTFFLYLNDVEEGGATAFPLLRRFKGGMKIFPKKGRALLWPSVLSHDPNMKDVRTDHEAQKVIKGEKYGANAWIHLRDFQTANKNGCS